MKSNKHEAESGFTLVELMIAIAIMAILISGSLLLLTYMVRVSDDNRDKTFASLQAQYIGFWISEDVAQAGNITLGNSTIDGINITGFPLTLEWIDTGIIPNIDYRVEYNIVEAPAGDFWQLQREWWIDGATQGTAVVGEYLYVGQDLPPEELPEGNATNCRRQQYEFVSSLILEVTTVVDGKEASLKYEIHPRAFSMWEEV